jgi:cellulose biosynthesis protein BcsQ
VLLIDADDQSGATLFTRQREQRTEGKPLYTAMQSFEADVITLLKDAQPFNPDMRVYAFINKAFSSGSDNADAAAILQEHPEYWLYLDTTIGNRKAFSSAFGKGNAITEHTPKDAKAINEMMTLYLHIFDAGKTQQLRNLGA